MLKPTQLAWPRWWWAWWVLLLAGLALLHGPVTSAPWVLDDEGAVVSNITIRTLDPAVALRPPVEGGLTVAGRPLLNLSFALNHALGELDPRGYRWVNLALHGFNAGLLALVLVMLLARAPVGEERREWARLLAAVTATWWALHPLVTGAVAYVAQRAEVLAATAILAGCLAVMRAAGGGPRARLWWMGAVLINAAGMAVKETVAVLPLLALLYDRVVVSGSWREVGRRHAWGHGGMMAGWLVLALLVLGAAGRGGSVGWLDGAAWWQYPLLQGTAILRYLWLTVWPVGLVFDYGAERVLGRADLLAAALVLTAVGASVWAAARRSAWGWAGVVFFLLLAPSSSVVPVLTQTLAEHRAYLASAVVLALVVGGLGPVVVRRSRPLAVALAVGVAVVLAVTTALRLTTYRTVEGLWADTANKRPQNVRAHVNLGGALLAQGQVEAAAASLERSLALQPGHVTALHNLGLARWQQGRAEEAIRLIEEARRREVAAGMVVDPHEVLALAHQRVGLGHARTERWAEAHDHFRRAVEADPDDAGHWANLGNVLLLQGRAREAEEAFARAKALRPEDAGLRENLALAREMLRRGQHPR